MAVQTALQWLLGDMVPLPGTHEHLLHHSGHTQAALPGHLCFKVPRPFPHLGLRCHSWLVGGMAFRVYEVTGSRRIWEEAVCDSEDEDHCKRAWRVLCPISWPCSWDNSQLRGKRFEYGSYGFCTEESDRMGPEELIECIFVWSLVMSHHFYTHT